MKKIMNMLLSFLLMLGAVAPTVSAKMETVSGSLASDLHLESVRYGNGSVQTEDGDKRLADYQAVVDRFNKDTGSYYAISNEIREEILNKRRSMNLETFEAWLRNNHATGSFELLGSADPQSNLEQSSGVVLIPNVKGPLYVSHTDLQ